MGFRKVQVRNLVQEQQAESVLMAYGISAAGKTYTIEGTRSEPGLLPRALDLLFQVHFRPNHHATHWVADMQKSAQALRCNSQSIHTLAGAKHLAQAQRQKQAKSLMGDLDSTATFLVPRYVGINRSWDCAAGAERKSRDAACARVPI